MKDSLKFIKELSRFKPYVYISAKNCVADSLRWGYPGLKRTIAFPYKTKKLNKDYTRCFINDTSYAWLIFNNCENGRGYLVKLPYSGAVSMFKTTAALNNFDPKFSVADGLVAYTDQGNIFVEEMATQKKGMVTFGRGTQMDFDFIHESIDSVNITPSRVWARVNMSGEWTVFDKPLTMK